MRHLTAIKCHAVEVHFNHYCSALYYIILHKNRSQLSYSTWVVGYAIISPLSGESLYPRVSYLTLRD